MSSKEQIRAKAPTKSPYTAPRSVLPFRPFSAVQSKPAPSTKQSADASAAARESAKPRGFSFADVRVKTGNRKSGGTGRSLPEILRRKMEVAFNTDFSIVRVHENDKASSIGALAYTQGENIHFARGEYQPGSPSGEKLIGHELTHILQQRAGRARVNGRHTMPLNADPALEAEASRLGTKVAQLKSFTEAGPALLQRHAQAGVSTFQGNLMAPSQPQPIQCAYRYDHVNKRFWKEDPGDEQPEDHPEGYEDVSTTPKFQLRSGYSKSPKPPSTAVLKGGKVAELFSRSEASMKRKVERYDPERVKKLQEDIEKAPSKPSQSDPLFPGTSFFHQALVIPKAKPTALKLKTYPKVYTNTRPLKVGSGEGMNISPPEMLVDPGGTYPDLIKEIPPIVKNLNVPLSEKAKSKELFKFLDKPMSEMSVSSKKEPPSKKLKAEKEEPEEDLHEKAQEEIGSSRELVGLKHLTMGVEGFRREGVHMANRIHIESELEKEKPNLGVLISDDLGIMAPPVSTQWHYNPEVNEQQQLKFGKVVETAKKMRPLKREGSPFSDFVSSYKKFEKSFDEQPPKEKEEAEEFQKKRKRLEREVVHHLNRYSKKKEALTFIPTDKEEESEDEDNPLSYQVPREKSETIATPKKRKKSVKSGTQIRVTKKKKEIRANDSPSYKNFITLRKLPEKEFAELVGDAKSGSVKKIQEQLKGGKYEMSEAHVKQLLVDRGLRSFKGIKKSKDAL